MAENPYHSAIEALDTLRAQFSPENARHVEGALEHLPTLAEAARGCFGDMGQKIVDEFPINPAPGEAVAALGGMWGQLVEPLSEMWSGFSTSHEDDFDRINGNSGRVNEHKWDVSLNGE